MNPFFDEQGKRWVSAAERRGARIEAPSLDSRVALELLGTKRCIPCHYGTFPLLKGTPEELKQHAPDVEILTLEPGETITV